MLSEIRIKTPCPANWDDMSGDERARFCGMCKLSVYNISDMTTVEAESFLRERSAAGERTCIKMFVRPDGKVLTDDCPRVLRRLRTAAAIASGRIAMALQLLLVLLLSGAAPTLAKRISNGVDEAAKTVDTEPLKGQMLMGKPSAHGVLGEAAYPATVTTPATVSDPATGTADFVSEFKSVHCRLLKKGEASSAHLPPPAVPDAALTESERVRAQQAQKLMLAALKLMAGNLEQAERNYSQAAALLSTIPGKATLQRHAIQQQIYILQLLGRYPEASRLKASAAPLLKR